jgi:hypothetical protein
MRQVIDEPLLKLTLQEVVEQSHGRPGVCIQQPLRDVVVPVLLVVSKGVNRPQRPPPPLSASRVPSPS